MFDHHELKVDGHGRKRTVFHREPLSMVHLASLEPGFRIAQNLLSASAFF